jgi:hypothetical protein
MYSYFKLFCLNIPIVYRNVKKTEINVDAQGQKWGAIHEPKSLWDLKNETFSLHFSDSTLVKVISL